MKKNSKIPLYLGIDTSAYTTSIVVVFDDDTIYTEKEVLKVPEGHKGLRQSEAVFQHVRNFPVLYKRITSQFDLKTLLGVAVSTRPRPLEDSYMPVFEVGKAFAETIAQTLGIPLFTPSHQENHIQAVLFENSLDVNDLEVPFLAVHFSGGTSEIILVRPQETGFSTEIIARSLDLKAGQLIDRVGVRFGLAFPAGKELDLLAQEAQNTISIPSRLTDENFHFSGQENFISKLIEDGVPQEEIASALFRMIAKTLDRSIRKLSETYSFSDIIFSGGVMSNSIIQDQLRKKLSPAGFKLYFSSPSFSADNAVGNAIIARNSIENKE